MRLNNNIDMKSDILMFCLETYTTVKWEKEQQQHAEDIFYTESR